MQVTKRRRMCLAIFAVNIIRASRKIGTLALLILIWCSIPLACKAQDLSAMATLDLSHTSFGGQGTDLEIRLPLSQPVPWRVRLLSDPPRVIMDFREVDFGSISAVSIKNSHIKAVRAGVFRPGWSRLVLELDGAFLVTQAQMKTTPGVVDVTVKLAPTDPSSFARAVAEPEPKDWQLPKVAPVGDAVGRKTDEIVVVLDPGHGGIDPGAEREGQSEANLMLSFARQLKELLLRDGIFKVVMTRNDDIFVPLEARISVARLENADVFISLHADALEEGVATGAVIYTLSDKASQAAGATLAERHDRNDLLAGVTLDGQDDLVATVLMDMARTETAPRTNRLATSLEEAMVSNDMKMHRFPLQQAGFSVLKSPDIPSVLIELGFLSSKRDRAQLLDKKWRARMAEAIRNGLMIWAQEDAALRGLGHK